MTATIQAEPNEGTPLIVLFSNTGNPSVDGHNVEGVTLLDTNGQPYVAGEAVYNSSPPVLTPGQISPVQLDSSGNQKTNPRLFTVADAMTVLQSSAAALAATVWLYDGFGNPLASWSPTGGTNMLKVATADSRILYTTSGLISAGNNSGDLSVGNVRYLALDVNVTAQAGTSPTITFFLDRKGADGVYYQVWASPASSAISTFLSLNIGPGLTPVAATWGTVGANTVGAVQMILGTTVRLRWTIGGSASPSVTCSVNLYQQA